ncbi:alpha/beta hydrolase [Gordonia asplenii]|uniref:alpha/beta hydrolase n=1 Tax=Gordonia asplenii TaxID=2725283 RepID=UPI0028B1783E|nr:alpha/beta hydrolase [Gordonia asplenii]
METFTETGIDGNTLAGRRWDPTGDARAVLVLVHGMGEHSLRYAATAEFFADKGFVVYAYDHRGHGLSKLDGRELGDLGENGWTALVGEIGVVVDHAVREHPDLPLAILGHSMGSFATQQYLLTNSDVPDAVILSGTAALDGLEPALDLDAGVDLSAFNAPFEPARTGFEWLSRDEAEVDKYVADEFCGFGIDAASGKAMFVGARPLADASAVGAMRSELPILVAVGEHDPVNGQLALANLLLAHFAAGGLTDVTLQSYPEARHEILNETNREEVRDDLLEWVDAKLSKA